VQLENVAIDDVFPLKAARRHTIANLKCFGAPEHERPNFDGFIYIHYAAASYSARISSIYLLSFGTVWLGSAYSSPFAECWPPCATPGSEAERRFYGGCVKTTVSFYLFVDQSSQNFGTK